MTIKELIKQLEKHPNQNAIIEIIVNKGNVNDESQDIICNNIEIWNTDNFAHNYITLFTYLNK